MDKIVKFAIIGSGKIGVRHAQLINENASTKLVAVCDSKEEMAKLLGEKYSCDVYKDYLEMIKRDDIDIVSVCSPSGLHAEMSISCLKAKKHVLCEKPMALNINDADAMLHASAESGSKLFVVKQNRYNAPIVVLKDAIDKKNFGKLLFLNTNVYWNRVPEYYADSDWRGTKKLDGGPLFTLSSHFIDLLIWIGGPIVSVFAKTDTFMQDIETDDTGVIIFKFLNGAIGTMNYTSCTYNKNMEGSITVLGTRGSAKISGEYLNKLEHWNVEGYPLDIERVTEQSPANDYGSYKGSSSKHNLVIKNVVEVLLADGDVDVDGFGGKSSVEVIEAAYLSAKLGKEIFLPLNEKDKLD